MDVQLPQELLQHIFSYLATDQKTLHACSLTSSSWYLASVAYLYDNPIITGKNYDSFVRAMCPSVNAHVRRNGLADLVRRLDMSGLVHNGSKSLTARLLGRVKKRLEEFVAPQASFAYGELPRSPLKVLQPPSPRLIPRLRSLVNDRSLTLDKPASQVGKPTPTYVSLRTEPPHLNRALHREARLMSSESADMLQGSSVALEMTRLTQSYLAARSSAHDASKDLMTCTWPATLRELHISGGIHDEALVSLGSLPPSLSHLRIGNCPRLSIVSIGNLLQNKGPQLQHLEIIAPIPALSRNPTSLNDYMKHVPNLLYLKISLDFVSHATFPNSEGEERDQYPLKQIDIDCFDPAECEFYASDLWAVTAFESRLGRVRKVGIHRRLGWTDTREGKEQVRDLDDMLKALAREDGPNANVKEVDAGVVLFGKR